MNTNTACITACIHCGRSLGRSEGSGFCCRGCEVVYSLLQSRGLGRYYDLKAKSRSLRPGVPASERAESFAYLDEPDFLELYARSEPGLSGDRWMEFYLEGVHCVACIWLTEKVAELVDHVRTIRLNLGNSVATVRVSSQGSFAAVAEELQRMGYRPHPIRAGDEEDRQRKENQQLLIRMGIAGACAGNIMLLAVSLYGGATGDLARNFRWISLGLFLPVILYSATPFYRSAWSALRARQASIDIPVVFGILLGAVASGVNLISGSDQVYFDSLAALIFLLLCTRYILRKAQQTALSSTHLIHFLTPAQVSRWNPATNRFEEARLDRIQAGDLVRVQAGECVPVDGKVREGESTLNNALLTGESKPVPVIANSAVFAGTLNLEAPIEIEVMQSGTKTRLGGILRSMEEAVREKSPIVSFADRVSRIFVVAVVGLSAAIFLWGFGGHWHEGVNRALALAIVTCPCAFALATPLAEAMTLGRLARAGILVKRGEAIERLSQVEKVFLDKTGTLTYGNPEVIDWKESIETGDRANVKSAVFALESRSAHPIARAIVRYLTSSVSAVPAVAGFRETLGVGVSGNVDGARYEMRRSPEARGGTEVAVFREGVRVATIALGDRLRPESSAAVARLQELGLSPRILSGDGAAAVVAVAREVGIEEAISIAEASPERKAEIIQASPRSLMVGDGANDAVALARAHVGVAVHSGMEISLRAADVYLSRPGVEPICQLVTVARETMYVIRRNLAFSILYNALAGVAALTGRVDPLFAAILMPISSLTVLVSSIVGTRHMRKTFRELNP